MMISTLIIVFREAFEASLIIGIAMAASKEIQASFRWIYAGVAGGLVVAVIVALFAETIASSVSGMGQELFNATVLILASMLMIWTAFWMRKHGKETSQRIHQTCDAVSSGGGTQVMLSLVVGLAVCREGSELVLFMYGVTAAGANSAMDMLLGGISGLLLGVLVAVLLYNSMVRIPMHRLFSVLTTLIVVLAAGMASQGAAFLVIIDALPALGQTIWNTSQVLPEHGFIGQVLQALVGYDDRPSGMQVLVFFVVLLSVITGLRIQIKKVIRAKKVVSVALFACLMPILSTTDADAKKVYSPIVEQGELELEYSLDYTLDNNPGKDGTARHQYEFEYGVTDRWMTAIYGDYIKRPNQDLDLQAIKLENIFQLFEQGERWLDSGLYLEYIMPSSKDNKPDVFEVKLLLEKESSRWSNTMNLTLKKELGVNATKNTTAGYAYQMRWRYAKEFEPAFEIYGSVGELGNMNKLSRQSHSMGPVILGKFASGLGYEFGYLKGITTESDDGLIKFILGFEL